MNDHVPICEKFCRVLLRVVYTPTAQGTEPATAQALSRDFLTCRVEIKRWRRTFYGGKPHFTPF